MGTPKIIAIASQTEMCQMRKRPLDKPVPLKRKIERCLMCPSWWSISCELQGMYGLQGPTKENIPTSPVETIHSSHTNETYLIHSTWNIICSNNQAKFLRFHKYRARSTCKPTSSANLRITGLKKYDGKPFSANGNYTKPPHNYKL
jgi:hypothetical protein